MKNRTSLLNIFVSILAIFLCQSLWSYNLPGGTANNGAPSGTVTWNANVVRSDSTITINAQYVNMMGTITVQKGKTLTIKMNPNLTWKDHLVIRTSDKVDFSNGFNGKKNFTTSNGITTLATTSMFHVEEGASLNLEGYSNTYYMGIKGRYNDFLLLVDTNGNVAETGAGLSSDAYLDHIEIPSINSQKVNVDFQNGAICTLGNLALKYVRLYDFYTNSEAGAITVPSIDQISDNPTYGKINLQNTHVLRCCSKMGAAVKIGSQIVYNNDGSIAKGKNNTAESCAVNINDSQFYTCYNTSTTNCGTIRTAGNTVGSITLNNVTIRQCSGANSGGAIYWNGHGTSDTKMTFIGCNFHHNMAKGATASANASGGAMVLEGSFKFQDKLTTIKQNKADYIGAGVCVFNYGGNVNSLEMSLNMEFNEFVKITENYCKVSGGGLGFDLGETTMPEGAEMLVNINGAEISSNTAENYGGGIYYRCRVPKSSGYIVKFTIDGETKICDNTVFRNGGAVYLEVSDGDYITPSVNFNSGEISRNTGNNGGAVYIMKLNVDSEESTTGVKFENNTARYNGGAIYINAGSLVLRSCTMTSNRANGEVDGNGNQHGYGGAVYIAGGNLTMHGGTLGENTSLTRGGAVCVQTGNVTINGGSISTNTAGTFGGGIYTENGKITIANGEISNNIATKNGGGLYSEGGQVAMTQGSIVSNTANEYGGGIYLSNGSASMSNGNINSNKSGEHGGGVYVKNSYFEFSGGTINGNTAGLNESYMTSDKYGGGIFCNMDALQTEVDNVVLRGGELRGNKAAKGAAVYLHKGNALCDVLYDDTCVTLTENYAKNVGAAFAMYNGSSLRVNGGTFKDNYTDNNGGAIYMNSSGGILYLNGGTFTGNHCPTYGGAININAGTCNITGGRFEGNYCENSKTPITQGCGGVIYLLQGVTANIEGGEFVSNRCSNAGGAIYLAGSKCTIAGGEFTNNTAVSTGGAISLARYTSNSVNYDGALTIKGGIIESNKAGFAADGSIAGDGYGGGIHVRAGDCNIIKNETTGDGAKISNNTATKYGGGVYVINESNPEKRLIISGGIISTNTAERGGGLYVVKSQVEVSDGQIIGNTAINGGGMFVAGGSTMTFGNGLIANNRAMTTLDQEDVGPVNFTTAYNPAQDICGVGGGVFLGEGSSDMKTTLTFNGTGDFGLYNNQAEVAADDIYSYGVNTSITLPNISQMSLKGYQTKTSELYWVEDYMTNDSAYPNLTATAPSGYMAMRYRDAVAAQTTVYKQVSTRAITGYLCLSLGHEIIYISIMRKGLLKGENAVYNIYRYDDKWVHYSSVILSGPEDAVNQDLANQKSSSKRFAVYSGEWRIEEAPWAWSYTAFNAIERIITGVSSEAEKTFIFSAEKQPSSEEGYVAPNAYSESMVANDYGSGVVTKDKGAPESNSSYEIIQDNEIKW